MTNTFNNARTFIYRNARPLDIVKTQLEDGSWNIPWSWNGYPEEWVVSKNWWKGNGAILNMLYLKGMGRLM